MHPRKIFCCAKENQIVSCSGCQGEAILHSFLEMPVWNCTIYNNPKHLRWWAL